MARETTTMEAVEALQGRLRGHSRRLAALHLLLNNELRSSITFKSNPAEQLYDAAMRQLADEIDQITPKT